MMGRSKKELQELIQNVAHWYEDSFGQKFESAALKDALKSVKEARLASFCQKRLGHLSDRDLFNLERILFEEGVEPLALKEVIQPISAPIAPPSAPIASPNKMSSEHEGKRYKRQKA